MATPKEIKEFITTNEDRLISLVGSGLISADDFEMISAPDDVNQQSIAFKNINRALKKAFSDSYLNEIEGALNKDDFDKINKFRESVDKLSPKSSLLSEKIIDQINESGIEHQVLNVLKNLLNNMSDKDTREFIFNNEKLIKESFTDDVLENIPDLYNHVYKAPDYGVADTDYDKMFKDLGKEDVLDNFYEMDWRDIAHIAKQKGITFKELMSQMQDAKIVKERDDIAHGRNGGIGNRIGGTLMSLVTPRRQEAIARGEDPSFKDTGLDIAENVIYSLPVGNVGRAAKLAGGAAKYVGGTPVGKALGSKVVYKVGSKVGSKVGKGLEALGGTPVGRGAKYLGGTAPGKITTTVVRNAVAPAATEFMDANAYDEYTNPRGDFSWADVLLGTAVNTAVPLTIQGLGGHGKKLGADGVEVAKGKINKTRKDIADEAKMNFNLSRYFRNTKDVLNKLAYDKNTPSNIRKEITGNIARYGDDPFKVLVEKDGSYILNDKANKLLKISRSKGKNLGEQIKNTPGYENFTPDKDFIDLYDKLGLEKAKGAGELFASLIRGPYLTNRLGDVLYGNEAVNIPMEIPFIQDFNRMLKSGKEDKARKKKESDSKASDKIGEGVLKEATLNKFLEDAEKNKQPSKKQMEDMQKNLRREGDISINRLFNNILNV